MSQFPEDDFDPSRPKPNPVQLPYAKSERVKGGTVKCATIAERDAIPLEWREEGTTLAFVDNDWGTMTPPEVPEGGWFGQPDPADPDAPLPNPDERDVAPAPPGGYYVLRDGITNECWVPFGGGGGLGTYTNPGTETQVGGCPVGTVFENTPIQEVLDRQFQGVFGATATITALTGAGITPYGQNQAIYVKGTTVEVTVVGSYTVKAGTFTSRRLEADLDDDPFANPGGNSFTEEDPTPRTTAVEYVASATYVRNVGGGTGSVTSTPFKLTPYALSYYGVVVNPPASGAAPAGAMTAVHWGPAGSRSFGVTGQASLGQRTCLEVPVALGTVKKIKDASGFVYYDSAVDPAVNSFTRTLITRPIADGSQEPYQQLLKKTPAGAGTIFFFTVEF